MNETEFYIIIKSDKYLVHTNIDTAKSTGEIY